MGRLTGAEVVQVETGVYHFALLVCVEQALFVRSIGVVFVTTLEVFEDDVPLSEALELHLRVSQWCTLDVARHPGPLDRKGWVLLLDHLCQLW